MLHPSHTKGMKHVSSTVPPKLRLCLYNKVSAARAGCNGPPRRRFAPALGSGKNAATHKTACTTRACRGGFLWCGRAGFRLSASWLCQDEDSLFIAHVEGEVKRESLDVFRFLWRLPGAATLRQPDTDERGSLYCFCSAKLHKKLGRGDGGGR